MLTVYYGVYYRRLDICGQIGYFWGWAPPGSWRVGGRGGKNGPFWGGPGGGPRGVPGGPEFPGFSRPGGARIWGGLKGKCFRGGPGGAPRGGVAEKNIYQNSPSVRFGGENQGGAGGPRGGSWGGPGGAGRGGTNLTSGNGFQILGT